MLPMISLRVVAYFFFLLGIKLGLLVIYRHKDELVIMSFVSSTIFLFLFFEDVPASEGVHVAVVEQRPRGMRWDGTGRDGDVDSE